MFCKTFKSYMTERLIETDQWNRRFALNPPLSLFKNVITKEGAAWLLDDRNDVGFAMYTANSGSVSHSDLMQFLQMGNEQLRGFTEHDVMYVDIWDRDSTKEYEKLIEKAKHIYTNSRLSRYSSDVVCYVYDEDYIEVYQTEKLRWTK